MPAPPARCGWCRLRASRNTGPLVFLSAVPSRRGGRYCEHTGESRMGKLRRHPPFGNAPVRSHGERHRPGPVLIDPASWPPRRRARPLRRITGSSPVTGSLSLASGTHRLGRQGVRQGLLLPLHQGLFLAGAAPKHESAGQGRLSASQDPSTHQQALHVTNSSSGLLTRLRRAYLILPTILYILILSSRSPVLRFRSCSFLLPPRLLLPARLSARSTVAGLFLLVRIVRALAETRIGAGHRACSHGKRRAEKG